jgi:hypothetical protein
VAFGDRIVDLTADEHARCSSVNHARWSLVSSAAWPTASSRKVLSVSAGPQTTRFSRGSIHSTPRARPGESGAELTANDGFGQCEPIGEFRLAGLGSPDGKAGV